MHSVLAVIDWSSVIGQVGVAALTVLVVPLVLFLLPKIPGLTTGLFTWVTGQAKNVNNQFAKGVLERMISLVEASVLAFEQTRVSEIKAMLANGTITPEALAVELAKVKVDVIAHVKGLADAQGLWEKAMFLFSGQEGNLSKWVDTQIEAAVAQLPVPPPAPLVVVPVASRA